MSDMNAKPHTLLVMAGGTGGHIMPGLSVAHEMRRRGWNVVWMGHPDRMEGRLVPAQGFELKAMRFAGVRGKSLATLAKLPFTLLGALRQANGVLREAKPDVVLGMGGYVAFPGGLMSFLKRVPLVVHEQNAVAGTANRWLARMASKAMTGFPGVLPGAVMVGNPVREAFLEKTDVEQRYAQHSGPLRLLVVGGSLGASILNTVVPRALALLPQDQRPVVTHQSGEQHIADLKAAYAAAGVRAQCEAFIDDMASAMRDADLVICRAGAMTVAEVAAVGVAALFIPLPHAIDDHQTANARYLTHCHGAWQQAQNEFTDQWLADWLRERSRAELAGIARHAHTHAMPEAARHIADACEQASRRTV